ncbi:MAG: TetR/AcrR family transcriptional regulator [Solirubrobacteraceae bacterium]
MTATPPEREPLRIRYDHRVGVVVSHAAREFADRGFHATTMQDLMTATGLTAGGLYHYIGSKDDLLVMICDELMERLLDEVRVIVETNWPSEIQLRLIVRAWLIHVETHRDHMRVFQQERHVLAHGKQWRAVRRQRKDFEELLAGVLELGEQQGNFEFADRDLALRALLGMVNHTAQWFRVPGRLTAEQIADGYVDLLLGRPAPPDLEG